MTDPRLSWLMDRLAEDEAAAKKARRKAPSPWEAYEGLVTHGGPDDWRGTGLWDDEGATSLRMEKPVAKHVARWDPARALAVVAALRLVLGEHQPDDPVAPDCKACADERTFSDMAAWPCPTVRAIASIYADRPEYAEVWGDE